MEYDTKMLIAVYVYLLIILPILAFVAYSINISPDILHNERYPVLIKHESLGFFILCSLTLMSYPVWTFIFYLWRTSGDPETNYYPLSIPKSPYGLDDNDRFEDFMAKLWFFSVPSAGLLTNFVFEYFVTFG